MKIIRKIIEFLVGYTTIVVIFIIIVYDMINNFIFKSLPDIEVAYPAISSCLLVSLSTILIIYQFENRKKLEKIEGLPKEISSIIRHSGNVKFFKDIDEVDNYIAKRISEAKESVCDLNWQDFMTTNPMPRNEAKKKHISNQIDKEIRKFCNHKKDKREYKEIFTFSYERNIDKMLDHINYGSVYSCRYFDNKEEKTKFPKIQFVIIDEEEIIFVSSSYAPHLYSLKGKELVGVFRKYFEQAWQLATELKSDSNLDKDSISYIESTYRQ